MAFRQYIVAGDGEPIFVNETGQRQYIVGGVAFINDSGFTSQGEPWQKARRKHARPLRRQVFGNVAATIPVVATFTGYARPRIQKARRKHLPPPRHRPVSPFIPVPPVPTPIVSHGYIKWTKPHRKRDAFKEIRAIVSDLAYGIEAVPEAREAVQDVGIERITEQVWAALPSPQIDIAGLVAQIMAVMAEYQRAQDEADDDDTTILLMGTL